MSLASEGLIGKTKGCPVRSGTSLLPVGRAGRLANFHRRQPWHWVKCSLQGRPQPSLAELSSFQIHGLSLRPSRPASLPGIIARDDALRRLLGSDAIARTIDLGRDEAARQVSRIEAGAKISPAILTFKLPGHAPRRLCVPTMILCFGELSTRGAAAGRSPNAPLPRVRGAAVRTHSTAIGILRHRVLPVPVLQACLRMAHFGRSDDQAAFLRCRSQMNWVHGECSLSDAMPPQQAAPRDRRSR